MATEASGSAGLMRTLTISVSASPLLGVGRVAGPKRGAVTLGLVTSDWMPTSNAWWAVRLTSSSRMAGTDTSRW